MPGSSALPARAEVAPASSCLRPSACAVLGPEAVEELTAGIQHEVVLSCCKQGGQRNRAQMSFMVPMKQSDLGPGIATMRPVAVPSPLLHGTLCAAPGALLKRACVHAQHACCSLHRV